MRDITVNVGAATEAEPAVACALALAGRFDAFLTGLEVLPGTPLPVATAGAAASSSAAPGDAASRQAWWQALCRRHGVAGAWETARGRYVPTLALRSLFSDLLVESLPVGSPEGPAVAEALSRVLFEGSAPLLLVPQRFAGDFDFRRIAVGWNGSREALRAIHAALPLLRGADEVTVYDGDRSGPPGTPPALRLREWLERSGVRFHWIGFDGEPMAGEVLDDDAVAWHAGLLVAGAWGRSRMGELVLGGATGWLLGHARLPLLLAH